MADTGLTLAQDLCARLCHDLVGPLGTMANAVDMVGEDPEAAELAREAASSLRAKLQLWRAACGAGTGPMGGPEIAALLDGVLGGGRATVAAGTLPPAPFAAPVAQLLLTGAMLAGEALPRGGIVHLLPEEGGVSVRPEGRVVAWPPGLALALAGGAAEGPRAVLAPMLVRLAHDAGWQAALEAGSLLLRPQRG